MSGTQVAFQVRGLEFFLWCTILAFVAKEQHPGVTESVNEGTLSRGVVGFRQINREGPGSALPASACGWELRPGRLWAGSGEGDLRGVALHCCLLSSYTEEAVVCSRTLNQLTGSGA